MFKFIAKLFAADTTAAPTTKTRLSLTAMEDRYAPATLAASGIIATSPVTTKAIIIEGSRTAETTGLIIEGGKTVDARGIIIEGV